MSMKLLRLCSFEARFERLRAAIGKDATDRAPYFESEPHLARATH